MAREPKRAARTENLSLRLDPKTKFVLEFMARVKGQSMTTVIERAILEAADNTPVGNISDEKHWTDYWNISDGVRFIKVVSDKRLFPSFEEEMILEFTKVHWPFFYVSDRCENVRKYYIEILWPKIDDFVDLWEKTKSIDYFAAGKAMQKAIESAGMKVPDWPPAPPPRPAPPRPAPKPEKPPADLDDDIPF